MNWTLWSKAQKVQHVIANFAVFIILWENKILQRTILTQRSNPGLLCWGQVLYHLITVYLYICSSVTCLVVSDSLQLHELWPARLLSPWDSPGKNTGVGCHAPSPGDLPNPGIEPRSLSLEADSLLFEPWGNPMHVLGLLIQWHKNVLFLNCSEEEFL